MKGNIWQNPAYDLALLAVFRNNLESFSEYLDLLNIDEIHELSIEIADDTRIPDNIALGAGHLLQDEVDRRNSVFDAAEKSMYAQERERIEQEITAEDERERDVLRQETMLVLDRMDDYFI